MPDEIQQRLVIQPNRRVGCSDGLSFGRKQTRSGKDCRGYFVEVGRMT
jgi:hypothetical protein